MLMPMLMGKGGGGNTDMMSMLAPMLAGKNGGAGNNMMSMLAPLLSGKSMKPEDILSTFMSGQKESTPPPPEHSAEYSPYRNYDAVKLLREKDCGNFVRTDEAPRQNNSFDMQSMMPLIQMMTNSKKPPAEQGLPEIKKIAPKQIQNGIEKLLKFNMLFE
jgi:hypothetical protein